METDFECSWLLGWIQRELECGKSLTDIEVQSLGPGGVTRKIKLTAEIWQTGLIRGAVAPELLEIWNRSHTLAAKRREILSDCLQMGVGFSKMCGSLIRDLHFYDRDKGARARLDSVGHAFYLGEPYFSTDVVSKLESLPTMTGTLKQDLERLAEKRAGTGTMCAAHDLPPLYAPRPRTTLPHPRGQSR